MNTYRAGLLTAHPDRQEVLQDVVAELDATWNHSAFRRFEHGDVAIYEQFRHTQARWETLKPELLESTGPTPVNYEELTALVDDIDQLVGMIQADAEQKIQQLRLVLVVALFATVLLTVIIMHWLRTRFELPMRQLALTARRIGQGDFTARSQLQQDDELGSLARTMNKMSDTISYMYGQLESRVQEQTTELQRSNTTLEFLLSMSRRINERALDYDDYHTVVNELRDMLGVSDIELCLLTEQGDVPYLQLQPEQSPNHPCITHNCDDCLAASECSSVESGRRIYRYPLARDGHTYGILIVRLNTPQYLDDWKLTIVESAADQLALSMTLKAEEDQVRRLALMKERTVIARELHDSLAQALSYLKIQVTRLNKAIQTNNQALIEDVSTELREGLNSAYRQLRELLTTFRLKVDGSGLIDALKRTIRQLQEQTDMTINLDYRLNSIPLAPHEEIHVLQIIREACQNAVHHSQGQAVQVRLRRLQNDHLELAVEDDGIGLPDKPEKLNHYGLAIIKERANQLGGLSEIQNLPAGGVGVYISFKPESLQQRASA